MAIAGRLGSGQGLRGSCLRRASGCGRTVFGCGREEHRRGRLVGRTTVASVGAKARRGGHRPLSSRACYTHRGISTGSTAQTVRGLHAGTERNGLASPRTSRFRTGPPSFTGSMTVANAWLRSESSTPSMATAPSRWRSGMETGGSLCPGWEEDLFPAWARMADGSSSVDGFTLSQAFWIRRTYTSAMANAGCGWDPGYRAATREASSSRRSLPSAPGTRRRTFPETSSQRAADRRTLSPAGMDVSSARCCRPRCSTWCPIPLALMRSRGGVNPMQGLCRWNSSMRPAGEWRLPGVTGSRPEVIRGVSLRTPPAWHRVSTS